MFEKIKNWWNKPQQLNEVVNQDAYIKFSINKSGEFDLELLLLFLEGDARNHQVLNITRFIKQFIRPDIYPIIQLALEKIGTSNPQLLIDTRAISNILNEFQQRELAPCIGPSEVFRIRNDNE